VRERDEVGCATVVLRVSAVVGGGRIAPILFCRFSIMGLPWHLGVRRIRRMVLCLDPGRSRQRLDVLFGPRTANGTNEAAFDDGISTEANER
jgi:hypothetical protein